jgi:Uma2 family endonuclease
MMLSTSPSPETEIFYPSRDGEPVAETYDHFYAIMITLEVLRQYLSGTQATVLANQFLYYAQGLPKLRIAPDVMVIFGVVPGGRDNYKIWEEGQVPSVVFEMTSKGTKEQDLIYKKTLYEQLGVFEYWLFDPRGEWISERLRGYRLHEDVYYPVSDGISQPLKLRLVLEEKLIGFYRQDTGEKLLIPDELAQALQNAEAQSSQERQRAEQERQRADQESQRAERLAEQLRKLGVDPDGIL